MTRAYPCVARDTFPTTVTATQPYLRAGLFFFLCCEKLVVYFLAVRENHVGFSFFFFKHLDCDCDPRALIISCLTAHELLDEQLCFFSLFVFFSPRIHTDYIQSQTTCSAEKHCCRQDEGPRPETKRTRHPSVDDSIMFMHYNRSTERAKRARIQPFQPLGCYHTLKRNLDCMR